jgi:glycosyltransferase involved in cell wall biosynthesis
MSSVATAAAGSPASAEDAGASFAGLRVSLVGPLPPPAGGMANQTRQLSEQLRSAGATVDIVQTNAPYRPSWAGRIKGLRALFRLVPYLFALWRAAGRSQLFHIMANSGWSWYLFAVPAIHIARWRGVAVIVNYRGGEAGPFLQQHHQRVAASMAKAQALVVPSGFLKAVFAEHGMEAAVVPNMVELARFHPAAKRPRGQHLMVARNLEALYDNATAIRALAIVRQRFPQAHMTVAGSGPELSALQALAAELGLGEAVHFAGRLDREAIAELYRQSDVAINPSTVDNMPNSVLEALASGVAVVSTDVGGVPYVVDHGRTALLVPARDPAQMAAAIERLLGQPDLAQQLVTQGLASVQAYTWGRVSRLLRQAYDQAVKDVSP